MTQMSLSFTEAIRMAGENPDYATRDLYDAIEKGNYIPSVLLALKLAHHFNVSVKQLFTMQEE